MYSKYCSWFYPIDKGLDVVFIFYQTNFSSLPNSGMGKIFHKFDLFFYAFGSGLLINLQKGKVFLLIIFQSIKAKQEL